MTPISRGFGGRRRDDRTAHPVARELGSACQSPWCVAFLDEPQSTSLPRRALERQQARLDHKFAEPVALSSTQPTDRPLSRRASRLSLDLIALRARRSEHRMRFEELGQVVSERLREHDASGARRTLDAPYGSRHSTGSVCLTSILVGTILGLLLAWNIIRDTRSQPS
jgi:hypothetical protein